jgi:hypothetical protein
MRWNVPARPRCDTRKLNGCTDGVTGKRVLLPEQVRTVIRQTSRRRSPETCRRGAVSAAIRSPHCCAGRQPLDLFHPWRAGDLEAQHVVPIEKEAYQVGESLLGHFRRTVNGHGLDARSDQVSAIREVLGECRPLGGCRRRCAGAGARRCGARAEHHGEPWDTTGLIIDRSGLPLSLRISGATDFGSLTSSCTVGGEASSS